MDTYLEVLNKMSEKERKAFFSKNTDYNVGSLVYTITRDDIGKVIFRKKDLIVVEVIEYQNDTNIKDNQLVSILIRVPVKYVDKELCILTEQMYLTLREKRRMIPFREVAGKYVYRILSNLFTEERVDVIEEKIDESTTDLEVTIHFPELTVKNSLDMTHTIKDVFLILRLSTLYDMKVHLRDFKLFRSTYEPKEVFHKYTQSHISKGWFGELIPASGFCLGNSSLYDFISKESKSFEINKLSYLVLLFKSFLEWESIEGVPYVHLSDLKPFDVNKIEYTIQLSDEDYTTLVEDLILHPINISFDFVNSRTFAFSKEVEEQIEERIQYLFKDKYSLDFYGEDVGEIIPITKEYVSNFKFESSIVFKGEEIKPKILEVPQHFDIKKKVAPSCIKYFLQTLDFDVTQEIINSKLESM